MRIIRELGLLYDSSLMADDEPYEIVEDGEPTGVVEIPVEWIRDDAPYLTMDRYTGVRPYTPPRGVLTIWRDEFDRAYADGGLFQLTMHPHLIGHRSRIAVLEKLIDHISSGEFPFVQPIPYYLEQVSIRFGPSRMMWGSDFPPVAAREGYRRALRLCIDQFADKSESARDSIFGDTARTVFRMRR